MRSELFQVAQADSSKLNDLKDTISGLRVYLENNEPAVDLLLKEICRSENEGRVTNIVNAAVDKSGTERGIVEELNDLIFSFLNAIMQSHADEDNPDDWVKDMTELNVIGNDDVHYILPFLQKIKKDDAIFCYRKIFRKRATESGVFPSWVSYASTVELRGISDSTFKDYDKDNYSPVFSGLVSVASISLEFDSGPSKEVFFNASRSDLEYLVKLFQKTLKEMESLEKSFQTNG